MRRELHGLTVAIAGESDLPGWLALRGELWPGAGTVEDIAECRLQPGASHIASDALLDNASSQAWHEAMGFAEVERIVAYAAALD